MAVAVYRTAVVWLLLCIMGGVFSLVVASGDDGLLPHVLRDIGGVSVWLVPLATVIAIVLDQLDLFRPDDRPPADP